MAVTTTRSAIRCPSPSSTSASSQSRLSSIEPTKRYRSLHKTRVARALPAWSSRSSWRRRIRPCSSTQTCTSAINRQLASPSSTRATRCILASRRDQFASHKTPALRVATRVCSKGVTTRFNYPRLSSLLLMHTGRLCCLRCFTRVISRRNSSRAPRR